MMRSANLSISDLFSARILDVSTLRLHQRASDLRNAAVEKASAVTGSVQYLNAFWGAM